MGTTLTGTTPQDTYDSLIKVADNGPISGTAKFLSDGLGNDSALALSTNKVLVGNTSVSAINETLNVTGAGIAIEQTDGGVTTMLGAFGSANTILGAYTNNDVILRTNNTERMRITSDGQLRVGAESDSDRTSHRIQLSDSTENVLSVQNATNTVGNKTSLGLYLRNSNNAAKEYAKLDAEIITNNAGAENGNLIFSTISSGTLTERVRVTTAGLTFDGDTAAANALDDYEEGTFTPFVSFSGGTTGITYSQQLGRYTKIGNVVNFILVVTLTNKGSSSGQARIEGLPFTIPAGGVNFAPFNIGAILNTTFNTIPSAVGIITTQYMVIEENVSGGAQSPLTEADFANNTEMRISGTYFV